MAFERLMEGLAWSAMAPISSSIAVVFTWMPPVAVTVCYYAFWWASVDSVVVPHLCAAIEAFSPHYGTHQHSGPPYRSPSKLSKLDLEDEEAEAFGVGKIEDFTQKQMLDFYACVECGRCTNVCPASNTGKRCRRCT